MTVSQIRKITVLAALGFALAACGGGDGGGNPPPPSPSNVAPVFTSTGAVDVVENTTGDIYTAAASDSDGDVLSFSVSGGADTALFMLDPSAGTLTFIVAPDFEVPSDVGADNVYDVTLSVSDSQGGQASLELVVTVTDEVDAAQVRRVGQGFDQPLFAAALADGSGRMLIAEKGGRIRVLNSESGETASMDFLDVSTSISTGGEGGLLGFALAPDFATSRKIYINVTNASGDTEIREYQTFSDSRDQIDPSTQNLILTFNQPASNHNAGWLGFNSDGLLIIPTGDGGGSGDPSNFAQNPQSLLGKVLRIDVSSDDFPSDATRDYTIPAGNTFLDAADGLPEIYAVGLRNPFRASFDPANGDLLIADVGQNAIEEIDRLPMDDSSYNFGWAVREGTVQFKGADDARFAAPVTEYTQGTGPTQGRSVTGGHVYTGPVETLQGAYIFADFVTNNIWSVLASDLVNGATVPEEQFNILTTAFVPDIGSVDDIAGFGLDESQNLYIISLSGNVFRLEAAN